MPSSPIVLTARDFNPLLADPSYMMGAIDALERAMLAEYHGRVRQRMLADETTSGEGPPASLTLNFIGGEGIPNGITVASSGEGQSSRFVMLFDERTRELLALMEAGLLNPVRVGAEGGLGARHLAPPEARSLAMLGSGRQARTQMAALCNALPGLEGIKVFSPTREHRESFCSEMSTWLGRRIEAVDSAEAAIRGADIVDLVNTSHRPIFELSWIKPGALVIAITGRGEVPLEFLTGTRVIAPVWSTFSQSAVRDPFVAAIKAGTWTREDFGGELGAVIAGDIPARLSADEIVNFEATAVPVLEHATNIWAYEWARSAGAGTPLNLSA